MISQYMKDRQQIKLGNKEKQGKKPPKPIPKMSAKRKEVQKEYKKIVKDAIEKDPNCRIKSPLCTGKAQGQNHKQKRSPKNLLVKANLENACNACNLYVELNKSWAEKNGHFISRFDKVTLHDNVNGSAISLTHKI